MTDSCALSSLAVAVLLIDAHVNACLAAKAAETTRTDKRQRVEVPPSSCLQEAPLQSNRVAREAAVAGGGGRQVSAVTAETAVKPMELRWRSDSALHPPRRFGQHTGRACLHAALPANVLRHPLLSGHVCVLDFMSEAQEVQLVAAVDAHELPWRESTYNGRHQGKKWGVVMNLAERTVTEARVPFPDWLNDVVLRIRQSIPFLVNFSPNEANAISYDRARGDFLRAHVDERHLSGDVIVNVSLLGACTMTYSPMQQSRTRSRATDVPAAQEGVIKVHLPRRCLQVQSGKARYDFSHGIANADLEEPRRVSITFRESKLTH